MHDLASPEQPFSPFTRICRYMLTTLFLWTLWCLLHSLFIHPFVQSRLYAWSNRLTAGTYRLYYILFSLITLVPVIWYTLLQEQTVLFAFSGAWRIVQILLLCYAALMFYLGSHAYDMPFFLGLKQWQDFRKGRTQRQIEFHHSGILKYVRHPWYSGGIALLWVTSPLTTVSLPVRVFLTGYFIIGTMLEERRLKKELGQQYIEYCQKVPMLLPWKLFRKP